MGKRFKEKSSRFLALVLIVVLILLNNTAQVFAATPLYTYPTDPNSNSPSLYGVYLSDSSNTDYSFNSSGYVSTRELKAGISGNASCSASEYEGIDGSGVDITPNIQIDFSKNIIGKSSDSPTKYKYLILNSGLIKLYQENADNSETPVAANFNMNSNTSVSGSIFVSPATKLAYSTSYKIIVGAGITSNSGTTSYAYEILFKTKAMTPVWDTNATLQANNVTQTSLTLNWPASANTTDVTGFQVLNGSTVMTTCASNAQGYSVTGLTAGTGYTFTVNAVDSGNNVLGSLTASTQTLQDAQTGGTTPPSWTNKAVTASAITLNSITLTWSGASSDTTGYELMINNNLITDVIAGTSTSYTAINLAPGTAYTLEVEARNAAGNWSTDGPQTTVSTLSPVGTSDVPMTQGISVNFQDGITVTPTQLGGSGTVAVRNANAEVPSLPANALLPAHGSYTQSGSCYGITVKGDNGLVPNEIVVSVPVSFPVGTDLTKVGVHFLDTTQTLEAQQLANYWCYQTSTDLSEISQGIIKFTIDNFDSQGKDIIFGVFSDTIPPYQTGVTSTVSVTNTSVTFKDVVTDGSGISRIGIMRNGVYIGDSTAPILYVDDGTYQTTITDTPGPGTYTYVIEAFDSFGNHNDQSDLIRTVQIGGDNSMAGLQEAAIAGLENGSLIQFQSGDSADCVTRAFNLPVSMSNALYTTDLSWSCDRSDVISFTPIGQAVVTKPVGENEVPINLTATVTGTFPSDAKTIVIPVTDQWLPEAHVTSLTEINNAIANPLVTTLLLDNTISTSTTPSAVSGPINLDFQGKTVKIPGDKVSPCIFAGDNATFRNATFDCNGIEGDDEIGLFCFPQSGSGIESFDNITFIGTENIKHIINGAEQTLSITNCHFGFTTEAPIILNDSTLWPYVPSTATITISGCTFDNEGNPGYAIQYNSGTLNMSNNTISGYQGLLNGSPSAGILLYDDVQASINDNTISGCTDGVRVLTSDSVVYPATKTVYVQVNGTTVQDTASAATAGAAVVSGNMITPLAAVEANTVDILNGADPANPGVLYQSSAASQVPPVLSADTTNNSLGQPAVITFQDNSDWRSKITGVTVDGVLLAAGEYTVSAGQISISADSWTSAKDYSVQVTATGYAPATVTQTITDSPLKTPPTLTLPDFLRTQSDTTTRGSINISFPDDQAWKSAITGISYESPGVQYIFDANNSDYTITSGNINLSFDWGNMNFPDEKFLVHATGYADATIIADNYLQAPAMTLDSIGNSAGQDIDIFVPNGDARLAFDANIWYINQITSISVNGVALTNDQCSISSTGYIHIDGSMFPVAENYTIDVKATGYTDNSVVQVINAGVAGQVNIKADNTNNTFGNPIDLTFTDDSVWRGTITGITVNSVPLNTDQYSITPGKIEIAADAFPTSGTSIPDSYTVGGRYTIAIQSSEYPEINVNQYVGSGMVLYGPALTRDNTQPIIGNPIDLTFTDDQAWRGAINKIEIDDENSNALPYDLTTDQYVITAGNIHILPGAFNGTSTYLIRVFADGYYDTGIDQSIFNPTIMNPPDLTADSTNNVLSQAVDISFLDDYWRNFISGVKVNDVPLSSDQYQVTAGNIQIAPAVFTAPGEYTITVLAPSAVKPDNTNDNYSVYSYSDAVVEQTILAPVYSVTVKTDAAYTAGDSDGIKTMTVNDGVSGFKYFSINTTPVAPYAQDVVAVFVQRRNNSQIAISAPSVSCANPSTAKAGFNVQPGDVIEAYIVDDLTNDVNRNPIILQ